MSWQPTVTDYLLDAISVFEKSLPGWWWTIGTCHLSRDASCGPDRTGQDKHLLNIKIDGRYVFDEGFHCDDKREGSTLASSLLDVMRQALEAKKKVKSR